MICRGIIKSVFFFFFYESKMILAVITYSQEYRCMVDTLANGLIPDGLSLLSNYKLRRAKREREYREQKQPIQIKEAQLNNYFLLC